MKKSITLITALLLLLNTAGINACNQSKEETLTAPELDGTQWSLVEINGKAIIADSYISLYFSDETIRGSAGCNTYGAYHSTEEPNMLIITMLMQTEVSCSFPRGVLDQEKKYVTALGSAASYGVARDKLKIFSSENEEILVFERIPEYQMNPADLIDTNWQLISINGDPVLEGLSVTLYFSSDNEASGRAGCFNYTLPYTASGDDIRWGMTTRRDGELPRALEKQALNYTDILMWVSNYRLASNTLELYTSKGDTLFYEPIDSSDGSK